MCIRDSPAVLLKGPKYIAKQDPSEKPRPLPSRETRNAAFYQQPKTSSELSRKFTAFLAQVQGPLPRPNGGAWHRTGRKKRTPAATPPVGQGERPAWKAIVASKRRDFARKRSHETPGPHFHNHFASRAIARAEPQGRISATIKKKRRPRTTTSRPPSRRTSRRDRRRGDSSSPLTTPCPPTGARKGADTYEGGSSGPWWASTASSSRSSATSRPG